MTEERGARRTAVQVLLEVLAGEGHLQRVLNRNRLDAFQPRDRRLVLRLVYGVLRRLGELDYLIGQLSRKPLNRLDAEVLSILRVALFELRTSRSPSYAVVHQAVDLCRHMRKSSAGAFVNGILRESMRRKIRLPKGNDPDRLATRFNHPEWLVRRYLGRHGLDAAKQIMRQQNREPSHYLWVNTRRYRLPEACRLLDEANLQYESVDGVPNCLRVPGRLIRHPVYERGIGFLMDVSSQWIAGLPELCSCRLVGDVCAAPGGKSFVLASRLSPGGLLVAADRSQTRLGVMRRHLQRLAISNIAIVAGDQRMGIFGAEMFDFILLDVPCSGLGTLASNPDIRWNFREAQLARLQTRQLQILRSAFETLKPGRELLYATCSTEPEENEQVVEAFLREEPRVRQVGENYRTSYGTHRGQSFFAARLRRL